MSEICAATWGYITHELQCALQAGHAGDHHAEVEWSQDVTSNPAPAADVSDGFTTYLVARYGG